MTDQEYFQARREHAFLLRCEGMTLREIGERLGYTPERSRSAIWQFSKQVNKALKGTKFTLERQ